MARQHCVKLPDDVEDMLLARAAERGVRSSVELQAAVRRGLEAPLGSAELMDLIGGRAEGISQMLEESIRRMCERLERTQSMIGVERKNIGKSVQASCASLALLCFALPVLAATLREEGEAEGGWPYEAAGVLAGTGTNALLSWFWKAGGLMQRDSPPDFWRAMAASIDKAAVDPSSAFGCTAEQWDDMVNNLAERLGRG